MKTITKKRIAVFLVAFAVLVLGFVLLFKFMSSNATADEPVTMNSAKDLDMQDGPDLKLGRYYIDGDISQYYIEVRDNHTIQLKNVDYYEYVSWGQSEETLKSEDGTAELKKMAEEISQPREYKSIYIGISNHTFITTHYNIYDDGTFSMPCDYEYVDENTLSRPTGEIFKFVDENLWKDFDGSTELTDEGYKTVNAPTRIVDAVK